MKEENFMPENEDPTETRIRKLIKERWFTHETIFEDDKPFLFVGDTKALSLGSISTVKGKPKDGKGWVLALFVDGFLNGGIINSPLRNRKQVMLADTEQTGSQAQRLMVAVKNLGGNQDKISGVRLRGTEPDDIALALEILIKDQYENTALFILDGVIDAVNNGVNDEKEGMAFVRKLMGLAEKYNVHIIGIIHENKGDKNATGFFGGYMAKKGELTFSVSKVKEQGTYYHTIKFDDTRDAPIDDLQFIVYETENGVVPNLISQTSSSNKVKYDPRQEDNKIHKDKLTQIFKENKALTGGTLIERIKYHYKIGRTKALQFREHLISIDWIINRGNGQRGKYMLVEEATLFSQVTTEMTVVTPPLRGGGD